MNIRNLCLLMLAACISSCGLIRDTPKAAFKDGFYIHHHDDGKSKVYVSVDDDSLKIYQTILVGKELTADTNLLVEHIYPKEQTTSSRLVYFNKNSLDVDFLIIPMKYRFSQKGVPAQLNATLTGAVYVGLRTDRYFVYYKHSPLKKYHRVIDHYGASFGLFGGIGNSVMTPTTTSGYLTSEYDGVVFTKGVAGIAAINNFTVGLALGFDNLLDKNHDHWIYQSKLWFGLTFGLNLN